MKKLIIYLLLLLPIIQSFGKAHNPFKACKNHEVKQPCEYRKWWGKTVHGHCMIDLDNNENRLKCV